VAFTPPRGALSSTPIAAASELLGLAGFAEVKRRGDGPASSRPPAPTTAEALHEDLDLAAATVGREIASSSRRIIGLLPAGPSTEALSVAWPIARAIVLVKGAMVLVIDPERKTTDRGGNATRAKKADPVARSSSASHMAGQVDRGVVVIAPPDTAQIGAKGAALKALLDFVSAAGDDFQTALVDLTGLALPGELFDALTLVDGIVIVGKAGRVTAAELSRSSSRVPPELAMGIVLVE